MIKPNVTDEFGRLKIVVLGTAKEFGGEPPLDEAYDPKSKEHILNGTFPVEEDLIPELGFRFMFHLYRPDPYLMLPPLVCP